MDKLNINIEPKFVEYEDGEGGVGMEMKNVLSLSVDGIVTMEDWMSVKKKIDAVVRVINEDHGNSSGENIKRQILSAVNQTILSKSWAKR